jgi:hypothetical protein
MRKKSLNRRTIIYDQNFILLYIYGTILNDVIIYSPLTLYTKLNNKIQI